MANEVAPKKEFTTAISQWTNSITNLVTRDFNEVGVPLDEDNKRCAVHAMESIFHLVTESGTEMKNLNTSNLREVVEHCASLKLDAAAMPRECFFQLRKKQVNGVWTASVEMGIEGAGYEAMLRNYGVNVKTVYPTWVIKDGDTFVFPKRKGLKVEPPEWEPAGKSNKVIRVVVPIMLNDGTEQYLMSDRKDVTVNLFAHIRQNLMNETFGICASRYKATDKQKDEIAGKKEEIYEKLRQCETVDEMLAIPEARPYISAAWLDSTEAMITRKLINNCVKKFPKSLNTIAHRSALEMNDEYRAAQEEITENENAEDFIDITEEEVTDAV